MPTIVVPAKMDHLDDAKDYLKKAIPPAYAQQTPNVILVAEELLVNVFSYAYPDGAEGEAEISIGLVEDDGEEMLQFTVRDWGEPFNPFEEAPAPDLTLDIEGRPIGGLGIFLIKQVSQKQCWTYEDGTNYLRILFGRTPAAV